jgi:hypothetical protein
MQHNKNASTLPHLHRDGAHPCPCCTRTGCTLRTCVCVRACVCACVRNKCVSQSHARLNRELTARRLSHAKTKEQSEAEMKRLQKVCVCVCVCVCVACACVSAARRARERGESDGEKRERVCVCARARVWLRYSAFGLSIDRISAPFSATVRVFQCLFGLVCACTLGVSTCQCECTLVRDGALDDLSRLAGFTLFRGDCIESNQIGRFDAIHSAPVRCAPRASGFTRSRVVARSSVGCCCRARAAMMLRLLRSSPIHEVQRAPYSLCGASLLVCS